MKFRALFAAILALAFSTTAHATAIPATTAFAIPSVVEMKKQNLASKGTITTAGYNTAGDGGGNTYTFASTPCSEDGGSCVHDGAGNSFTANVNGDLRQFGVTLGSAYDWNTHSTGATDITPVLTAADAAAATQGIKTITLSGVPVYMATDYDIPAATEFTCGVNPSQTDNTDGYVNVPGAIHKAHGVDIDRVDKGASIYGCYILPSWYTAPPTDAQTGFALLANMVSNGDTGLICSEVSCHDHDLSIFGFDLGYRAVDASDMVLRNVKIDADVGLYISSTGGAARNANINVFNYLTTSVPSAKAEQSFTITKVENDGGLCKLTVTPQGAASLTDLQYLNYLYVTRIVNTSSACQGMWKLSSLDTGAGTFDLIGSEALGPSPYAHWAAGTNVIYTSNANNIQAGEVINGMDAQGIPTGTTVLRTMDIPLHPAGFIADTGTANVYVANAAPAVQPCTLDDILNVYFTPANDNTGASTLNITLNSASGCTNATTGAIAIVRPDGTALQAKDLRAGVNAFVRYSTASSKWILQQPWLVLSANTTLAQSAPISTHFVSAVCNPCGSNAEALFLVGARVDAGASDGGTVAGGLMSATGYLVGGLIPNGLPDNEKVAGFTCDDCATFDHMIGVHVQNANETSFRGLRTDSHGNTDNARQVIVLLDGQDNNLHVSGDKASKGGRAIVVNNAYPNSENRGAFTWDGASIAPSSGDLSVVQVYQGAFRMLNGVTNSTGGLLVANTATEARIDAHMPQITAYYEGDQARSVTDTTGSVLAGGQNYPWAGAGLKTDIANDNLAVTAGRITAANVTADTTATAQDCGTYYHNTGSSAIRITIPATPMNGCTFTFSTGLQKIYLIFTGNGLQMAGNVNDPWTTVRLDPGIQDEFFQITWDGAAWTPTSYSRDLYDSITPRDASIIRHGQVYLSHNSGSSQFELFPNNGPGGIITSQRMMRVRDAGLFLPDSATTSSALNYIYVYSNTDSDGVVTGAVDNGGGLIRLTITHTETTGAQVTMSCFSIGGAYQANGYWSGTVIDSTHIDLLSSSSVSLGTYTSGGKCRLLGLRASTTVPVVIANGVQSLTGDAHYTLVGYSNVAGSHAITNTYSYFNSTLPLSGLALTCSDFAFGAAAGTSPTCTAISGDDKKFHIVISTGTATPTSGIIGTLTFKSTYSTPPLCIVQPELLAAATKQVATWPTETASTFVLNYSSASALATSTAYQWGVQCAN